jgi:hypothetical protein
MVGQPAHPKHCDHHTEHFHDLTHIQIFFSLLKRQWREMNFDNLICHVRI